MARIEDATGETDILERLNKTMDDLITYRNIYVATIETANERMTKIEKKLEERTPETSKSITVQIEKIEEAIENMTKRLDKLTTELNGMLEGHENVFKEMVKERKSDLLYVKGLENEVKSLVITTEDRLKDMESNIAKAQRETESANRFKKAFQSFLKAVME